MSDPTAAGVLLQKSSPIVKMLLQVGGVSGLIALYLVYTLAAGVAMDSRETRDASRAAVAMLSEHLKEAGATSGELTMIRNLLLQSCINETKGNRAGSDACFDSQYRAPSRSSSR